MSNDGSAMSKTLTLIACCGAKLDRAAAARELYVSDLFRKSLAWANANSDRSMVLSARYGLVQMGEVIEPYDETLNDLRSTKRLEWANRVWASLVAHLQPADRVVILAGRNYREHLAPLLADAGVLVSIPLDGLGIGFQKQWLAKNMPADFSHPWRGKRN